MNLKFRDLINAPLSNLYAMKELQLVLRHLNISKNDKVLEIGCGNGLGSIMVSKVAKETVGIDISEPIIKLLKARISNNLIPKNELDFAVLDATQPCPTKWIGYFNKVFCIDVIEHIDINLREKLLDFSCKAVSPGGLLVITFPMNNYHHGHLITEEAVSNFIDKIRKNNFEAHSFHFKPASISGLSDKAYVKVQNLFYSEPCVDTFKESIDFKLLSNPKLYHKLIKVGTAFIFKISAILSPLYIPTQPRSATRALIVGTKIEEAK